MLSVSTRHLLSFGLLGLLVTAGTLPAQQPTQLPTVAESRPAIAARARIADSLGQKDEAERLRTRLRDGDFDVGDRLILVIEGPGLQKSDTAIVQAGKIISLGKPMGDIPVGGLLRSELTDSITATVLKYFKNETVHATPLVRIGIGGAVRVPGFHYVRRDMPLGDLMTRSGGLDQNADPENIIIKRGNTVVWQKADVASAMQEGLTIDRLGLEPGDQVVVAAHSSTNPWMVFLQYGVPVITAIAVPLLLRR